MLLSPLRYINPISGNRGGTSFSIANSFLSDGGTKKFSINNLNLYSDVVSTSTSKFTFMFVFKKLTNGSTKTLLSSWGFSAATNQVCWFGYNSSNNLVFTIRDSLGNLSSVTSTNTITDFAQWNSVWVTFDYSQSLGNRGKIYHNGLDVTGVDNLSSDIQNGYRDWEMLRNTAHGYTKAYLNQHALLNVVGTFTEYKKWYNNGKPIDIYEQFGEIKTVCYFNADDSGSKAIFTVRHLSQSCFWTSLYFVDTDKQDENPYFNSELRQFFIDYNGIKQYTTDRLNITGTTTEMLDYDLVTPTNLVNSGATNQPGIIAFNPLYNGKTSLNFTVDDMLSGIDNANLTTQTSGVIISVYKATGTSTSQVAPISFSDKDTSNIYTSVLKRSDLFNPTVKRGGTTNDIRTDLTIGTDIVITAYASDGTQYFIFKDGVEGSITSIQGSGSNNGDWFNQKLTGADTISIGGIDNGGVPNYGEVETTFSGIYPFVSKAQIIEQMEKLATIYIP